jgi:hypothetical protein
MAVANRISMQVKLVEQSALGTTGSSGSQLMRRRTFTMGKSSQTYANNEIVDHQMDTGDTDGIPNTVGKLDDALSPGSFLLPFSNLLRKAWATTTALTGVGLTVGAATLGIYPLTRSAGSWLSDGIKVGDIIRLSVGSMAAANLAKNLWVVDISSATVMSVIPLNGVAMVAEGPITGNTVTVVGKKLWTPNTGQLNKYMTAEKWYSDISKSEVFPDVKTTQAAVNIPGTDLATVSFDLAGLGGRTLGTAEVLTSPTAATTTNTLGTVQGRIFVNGVSTPVTNATFTINGNVQPGAPEVGSATISDHVRGIIQVKGTITTKFSDTVLQALRDAQTAVTLMFAIADSSSATADFITFVMPTAKIFTDDATDEAEVTRTYNFTAQYNGSGGAAIKSLATILSMQDSQA